MRTSSIVCVTFIDIWEKGMVLHLLHLNALLKILVSFIIRFILFVVTLITLCVLFAGEAVSLALRYLAYPLSFWIT